MKKNYFFYSQDYNSSCNQTNLSIFEISFLYVMKYL